MTTVPTSLVVNPRPPPLGVSLSLTLGIDLSLFLAPVWTEGEGNACRQIYTAIWRPWGKWKYFRPHCARAKTACGGCISAFATPILCDRCLEYGLFVIPRSSCTSVIGFFVQQRFFGVNGKGEREDAGKYASLYQTLFFRGCLGETGTKFRRKTLPQQALSQVDLLYF